ncbi:MAG: class I SAM-dependent methyltransferase [Ignavibacteriaceae bacterium]
MNEILNNTEFFNQVAEFYDLMIPFEETVGRKMKVLEKLIAPEVKFAADLGCGTGSDSLALAKLGINVSAFDPSLEMISNARKNANTANKIVNFYNHSISEIPPDFNSKFDLVISFGNTFANISKKGLNISLKKCFDLLRKGGTLFIQVLNYYKILSEGERIVNITGSGANLFVRFYDYNIDHIVFNLLKINKSNLSDYSLISTNIFPHLSDDFGNMLDAIKFRTIEFYGDLQLNPFRKEKSKDLIVKAVK